MDDLEKPVWCYEHKESRDTCDCNPLEEDFANILDDMDELDCLMCTVELIVPQLSHEQIRSNINLFKDQLGLIAGNLFNLKQKYEGLNEKK